jgi:hypothetical protein
MPYEYVPAYLAFLVAVASVAGGRSGDCWIAALSGWFLIHGHACFLLIVPVLSHGGVRSGWCRPFVGGLGRGRDGRFGCPSRSSARSSPCRSYSSWCRTGRGTSAGTSPTRAPRSQVATWFPGSRRTTRTRATRRRPGRFRIRRCPPGSGGLVRSPPGRYAVLTFPHGAWPAVTGIVAQAERSGVAACVADPWWEFMMTAELICTRKEILGGVRFTAWAPDGVPRGMPVLFRLRRGIVTYGPK